MKKVQDIPYFEYIKEIREYQFGKFYFFNGIVISEINQGVDFSWKMACKVVEAALDIFGEDAPIVYISNRINSYSANVL